jgi:hypothetical protein
MTGFCLKLSIVSSGLIGMMLATGPAFPCEIYTVTANFLPCFDEGTADPADDTFIADFTTTFADPPTTGDIELLVRGQTFSTSVVGLGTQFQFLSIPLSADGQPVEATFRFTAVPTCTLTATVGNAPGPCSAGIAEVVAVDVRPGSCPNPLNCKSKGVLPVAILGTATFDVTQIDPATVQLAGVAPLRWDYEDVATPYSPFAGKQDCDLDCTSMGPDGYMDATLKFKTQEVIAALGTAVLDGACVVAELTGNLRESAGGTEIVGEDVIRIKCEKR